MSEKKIQKIAVLVSMTDSDKMLILSGLKIASLFNKELCLIFNSAKTTKSNPVKIRQILLDYKKALKDEIPGFKISVLILNTSYSLLPEILADEYETILIIADSNKYRKYSKAVYSSPVPFLFINPGTKLSTFKKITLPVDLREGNSETALWSSYFGRLNNSEIIIIAANHKEKYGRQQVAKNIARAKNLFQKLSVRHKIFKGTKSSIYNHFEALDFAISSGSDMLMVLGSTTLTPLDYIVGLPEKKILKRAGNMAVLLVNSRRDNYLLCN